MKLKLLKTYHENILNVYSVSFCNDNRTFISGGGLPYLFIYNKDLDKAQSICSGHRAAIYATLSSNDYFFSAGKDGNTIIYDKKKCVQIKKINPDGEGNSVPKFSLAINPSQTQLAIGSGDGQIHFYNISNFKKQFSLKLHNSNVRCIKYSVDGTWVATGGSDNIAYILDSDTYKVISKIEGHADTVFSLAFSKDGQSFATGSKDARLRIWDIKNKKIIPKAKILGHVFAIKSIDFINNHKNLISVSQDKSIKIWDTNLCKTEVVISHRENSNYHRHTINSLSLSPNEDYLVTGSDDKCVKLWTIN